MSQFFLARIFLSVLFFRLACGFAAAFFLLYARSLRAVCLFESVEEVIESGQ